MLCPSCLVTFEHLLHEFLGVVPELIVVKVPHDDCDQHGDLVDDDPRPHGLVDVHNSSNSHVDSGEQKGDSHGD